MEKNDVKNTCGGTRLEFKIKVDEKFSFQNLTRSEFIIQILTRRKKFYQNVTRCIFSIQYLTRPIFCNSESDT